MHLKRGYTQSIFSKSGDDVFDHLCSLHPGQTLIQAKERKSQSLVVDSKLIENSCIEIIYMNGVFYHVNNETYLRGAAGGRTLRSRAPAAHAPLGLVAMQRTAVMLLAVLLNRLKLDAPFGLREASSFTLGPLRAAAAAGSRRPQAE